MPALDGLRVIDMATVFAGPGAARHLADFGADVIKVEAPAGDGVRRMGWFPPEGGDSYTWKLLGRNKRAIVLDLKSDAGRSAFFALVDGADVLIENLRPGTLERLGLGPEVLAPRNPRLVVLRVTGFGQDGPYAARPGFATMAEAMSGFAAINGEPDGPPLLPPIALTDEVAAIAGAFAVMVALHERDRSGIGQVIDVNLLESMLQLMSALPSAAAHLGYEQPRLGSGIPYSVPRGTYRCADDRWIAISTSAESVAHRVLTLLGLERRSDASRRSRGAVNTATSSTRRWRPGWARAHRPRCWQFSKLLKPRSRPCIQCERCWPIRTCRPERCSYRSTGSCSRGRWRGCRVPRPRCVGPVARSAPTPTPCCVSSTEMPRPTIPDPTSPAAHHRPCTHLPRAPLQRIV